MCTRNKNVGDLLSGSTLLSTGSENESKWKSRFKKYKEAKRGDVPHPIRGVVLGDFDSADNSEHLKKLQDGCSEQWSKSVTGDEEQSYLDAVKEWCSKEVTTHDS